MDHPYSGTHWADWGKDFYASTSFSNLAPDHERLWIAWMDNWQYAAKLPSLPGRGEMTVARALSLRQPPAHPAPTPGQEPLALVQRPVLSVAAHQKYRAMFGAPQFQTIEEANARLAKGKAPGRVFELRFELDPGEAARGGRAAAAQFQLIRTSARRKKPSWASIRRRGRSSSIASRSGKTDWSPEFPARMTAPMRHSQAQTTRFDIVVDENSVEVFAEDGETVLSSLIFPSKGSTGVDFYMTPVPPGSEPARVRDFEVFPLGK